jgi:hypothetical protein
MQSRIWKDNFSRQTTHTDLGSFKPTYVLNHSKRIGHYLAGMIVVCQTIDDWDSCILCKIKYVLQLIKIKGK